MMPLWTTASRSVAWGWALVSLGLPWVAQRVWPMPIAPDSGACESFSLEVAQLALGAPALEAAVLQGGDAGRIVAAILQPLQRVDDLHRDRRPAQNADNSAHRCVPFLLLRRGDRPRSSTRPPEPNAGHRAPAVLAAQVLPVALQSPNVADLTIAEILENRDKG